MASCPDCQYSLFAYRAIDHSTRVHCSHCGYGAERVEACDEVILAMREIACGEHDYANDVCLKCGALGPGWVPF